MKNNFSRGIDYALNGVKDFYKYPFLWKYTIFPFGTLLAIYSTCFYYTCKYLQPYILQKLTSWLANSWFEFLLPIMEKIVIFSSWMVIFIILSMLSNCIFESIGTLFFPFMIKEYEEKILKINSGKISFRQTIKNIISSIAFTFVIIFLYCILSILLIFFPIIGLPAFLIIMGYNYSIIFMSEACFNSFNKISDVKYIFMDKKWLMYGFGCFAFFILQLPFCSLFFYPGFMIGGTKMFYEEK